MADFVADTDIVDTDFIIKVTAGENLALNDAVYILASDGKAYKCDDDDATKVGFVGFVTVAANINTTVQILPSGHKKGFSSLTVGAIYYLSGTAGAITTSPGTNKVIVGHAVTTTTIKIFQGFKRVNRIVYTTTGATTWNKRPGLSHIFVKVQAAGGGTGGCDNSVTAGGASGAYTEDIIHAPQLGATETVTVGAGGTAGSTSGAGGTGGTSSFGSLLVCTGGIGSSFNNSSVPSGGTVTTSGSFSMPGQSGTVSFSDSGYSGGGEKRIFPCGAPSYMSVIGATVAIQFQDTRVSGNTPVGYGYGAPNQAVNSEPSPYGGFAGGQGIIIVEEYYVF